METIIFLYMFFTGLVFASWSYDAKDVFLLKFLTICCAFANGWYMTPILIGRAIKQIYKY